MFRTSLLPYTVMGGLLAALMVIAAGAGLLDPDIYRPFVGGALLAGLPVQDGMSLLAALGLAAAMFYARRGSLRAVIAWAGLLVFAGY